MASIHELAFSSKVVRRLWSRQEYERAGELGLFRPDERLELIGGEIVEKMSPQGSRHAMSIRLVEEFLRRAFAAGYDVRVQLPLAIDAHNEPEPDLSVVQGSMRDYAERHPATAVLVVEVADTSIAFDRSVKASLYAKAGISEYWVVNLADRVLERHNEPVPMQEQPFGFHYRTVSRHFEDETVAPAAAPTAVCRVGELLS